MMRLDWRRKCFGARCVLSRSRGEQRHSLHSHPGRTNRRAESAWLSSSAAATRPQSISINDNANPACDKQKERDERSLMRVQTFALLEQVNAPEKQVCL